MSHGTGGRWGQRDATAILIAYRSGLRASELVALRWSDIELHTGRLHVRASQKRHSVRVPHIGQRKPGLAAAGNGRPQHRYVFISECGAPLGVAAIGLVRRTKLWKVGPGLPGHSGLMPANLITLAHFSVFSELAEVGG